MQFLFNCVKYSHQVGLNYIKFLERKSYFRYSYWGESEDIALDAVVEACYYLDLYPKEVCRGMVDNVGSRLFHILKMSNVIPQNLFDSFKHIYYE